MRIPSFIGERLFKASKSKSVSFDCLDCGQHFGPYPSQRGAEKAAYKHFCRATKKGELR